MFQLEQIQWRAECFFDDQTLRLRLGLLGPLRAKSVQSRQHQLLAVLTVLVQRQ